MKSLQENPISILKGDSQHTIGVFLVSLIKLVLIALNHMKANPERNGRSVKTWPFAVCLNIRF